MNMKPLKVKDLMDFLATSDPDCEVAIAVEDNGEITSATVTVVDDLDVGTILISGTKQ